MVALQVSSDPPMLPISTDSATLLFCGMAPKSSDVGLIDRPAACASMINGTSALREPLFSFACRIFRPAGQLACAITRASKVPVRLTGIVPLESRTCPLFNISARSAALESERVPGTGCVSARMTGRPLSTVRVTEPPGTKPRPCNCRVPPAETVPLLLRESAGELASTKMMPPEAMTTTAASMMIAHLATMPVVAFEAVATAV